MNSAARRIGRTLALVLPVVLVLSGTLAVTRVPWASRATESQALTASSTSTSGKASTKADPRTPQDVLHDRLLVELQEKNPGVALTELQAAVAKNPRLARFCPSIARALGRAAVAKYAGAQHRAQEWSRPVCDNSFASGVANATQ
ncbi:hypothetical protein FCH28_16780 [Streptomyces piniterrae]|uniref:Uncharacterized protein n=1 Tax=Streptomyces piniterrae TaxID=2571125 RepID=A0A4U0NFL5_9ACTN|nr:hypothetical protein [Streptomyces piniterrae]TJZ52840.1 hypothetical protein FCH28_16780 [Streptomyces piniterrae]